MKESIDECLVEDVSAVDFLHNEYESCSVDQYFFLEFIFRIRVDRSIKRVASIHCSFKIM